MRRSIVLFLALTLTSCANWLPKDRWLFAASMAAATGDYITTIEARKRGYDELNPGIGSDPSNERIAFSMVLSQLAVLFLADRFERFRSWILGIKIALNTGCAISNSSLP